MTPIPPTPLNPASPSAATTDASALLDEPAAGRWYGRPMLWAAVGLLLLVGAGLWWWQARRAAQAAPSFTSQPVARGNLTLSITANGTLQPTRSVNVGSELSGTVLRVNADVNDRVRKGQVLVELDTSKLREQIKRSTATLASAHAKRAQTAATLTEAGATLQRLEQVARLSGGQVPSQTELDTARATLERAQADDNAARAGVADAQAALALDQISLSKASISAPTDAVVLTRSVEPGNAVAASLQAVTLMTLAEDLSRLRLWVYVDEADVGAVKIGQPASFTVSAYAARQFPARITRVGFGSTITDNVVTYLTYLDVDNADLSLRPGMTATATIIAMQRTQVLLVPNAALRFTPVLGASAPAAAKGGLLSSLTPRMPGGNQRRPAAASASTAGAKQVWILAPGGSGLPQAVAVTPGISDGRMTEIIGGDLREGMAVITDQRTGSAK